ncbi:hypothetical protein ACEWY4_018992 [Coilia grayii]|uniref:Carrier domain-containing protein n=1 Tax=Coilia grayii TaxID=363190 RepID=A0ABD1JES0_9TELE
MENTDEDIAVIGIGCDFPGGMLHIYNGDFNYSTQSVVHSDIKLYKYILGEGLDNFWKVLVEGKNCAVDIPNERFDCSQWYDPDDSKPGKIRTKRAALINGLNKFDQRFFGISDAETEQMDPQQKLLLQCSYRALEDAGIPMEKASGTRTGVYIGLMNHDFEVNLNIKEISHWTGTGVATSLASNRISYTFNLTGPSFTIDCACSSSLVALHLACQSIRQGDCDMALCGGVSCIISPQMFVVLSKAKMVSPDGTSKPFSSKADGYGRGEGCGVVLLKPLDKALQDSDHIWGVISKTAVNQDGHSVSPITKPSMIQQEELLRKIYSTEHDLTSVQYIEAHGTGTPVGDPIEAESISNAIAKARPPGSDPLVIGSVKGNIGHTESAAGVAGLIKVLLMMKHETIVPSVFYTEDSASIDAKSLNLKIPTTPEKWKRSRDTVRVAGISSFGFGGTNAHAIVKQHEKHTPSKTRVKKSQHCFVLSAVSEKSLAMMIADMAEQIHNKTSTDIQFLAYTSACKRSHAKHKYRKVFITPSEVVLENQLTSSLNKRFLPFKTDPKVVFVFCGNGVTYRGMCRQLFKEEPIFREKVTEIEHLLQSHSNMQKCRILEILENDTATDFSKPDVIQPLLFAVQVAIATLLKHWGVRPDAILGHSVGEVAAAHCSGLLSLGDAVKVIHYRSALQSKVTGGKMLVVSNMAVSEVLNLLSSYSGKVCLAAHNSPTSCTLSGDAESILALHQTLSNSANSKTLFLYVLDVPAAYHSHMMDPILPEVENSIGNLGVNELDTELYSTVSGKLADNHDFCTGAYWSRNIREPVEFEKALTAAAKDKRNAVFVEIGPKRALYRNIIETFGNDSIVLSSAHPEKDHETLLGTFARLFELGVNVNWDILYGITEVAPTALPRYQFDFVEKPISVSFKPESIPHSHPVLIMETAGGRDLISCDLTSKELPYLKEHKNNGVPIVPGALYVEMGLAAFMANAKPKAPLSTLQLSINFLSPFLLTPGHPKLKVKLEANKHETLFEVHSNSAVFASGSIKCQSVGMVDEQLISLECITKRCTSIMKSDEMYRKLDMAGFQYGDCFRNKEDVFLGKEFREAYSIVSVPEELLCQLHDFCIHPVILDYLLQMTLVTNSQGSMARPGIPAVIGSLVVLKPLLKEMVMYLKVTGLADDHFSACGCITNRNGGVLVEVRDIMVKYVESSHVTDKYFFHNELDIVSENTESTVPVSALVFSDTTGLSLGLKPYLSNNSRLISSNYADTVLTVGLPAVLAMLNISNVGEIFTDVLFMWGHEDLSSHTVDHVLVNMTNYCDLFRQVLLELRKINFSKCVRVVTYQSSEATVEHISPGFVLSGMTRSCAAEVFEFSFQLIDIGSASAENISALSRVLTSFPCKKYPELVVKDGQILQPHIARRSESAVGPQHIDHCSQNQQYTLLTGDAYKMIRLSAIPSEEESGHIPEKNVEVQLSKMCVHSSDYYPVSVSEQQFGQTMYWNKHSNLNHKLLALDFSGVVTAVGKGVRKLKVGDHIAACYPVTASTKVMVPEEVCCNAKKLSFFRDIPCISYLVVIWRVLHIDLPKLKRKGTLGVFSSDPNSVLVKVLILVANKCGWHTLVVAELSDPLPHLRKVDALVLLPPFNKSVFIKGCTVSTVKDVVVVFENSLPSAVTEQFLREVNCHAYIKTIETSNLLSKGSLRAHGKDLYRWLKNLHLDKKSAFLPNNISQVVTAGCFDLMPLDYSYFSAQIVPQVVLNGDGDMHTVSGLPLLPKEHRLFYKNCVYIVTGGLTGLGFETVRFIAESGGRNIVILSRRSPSTEMQGEIDAIKQQCGAAIDSVQCDIAVMEQVQKAVLTIEESFPSYPIKGIFHSAVVIHDALIGNLDKSLYEKVLKPKVNGALNLHHATKHCELDYFVCFSSISSMLGNASQTNYAAANSFLDIFCHYRRHLGLAAQSINWGALNLGLLYKKDNIQKFLESQGIMAMEKNEILQSLKECLLLSNPQQIICKFNYKNMFHHGFSQNPSLSIRLKSVVKDGMGISKVSDLTSAHKASGSSPQDIVRTMLNDTLGVEYDELSNDTLLSALGVDSMLGMTMQNLIFQETGINIPLIKLMDPNCTIASLASALMGDAKDYVMDENLNTKL